MPGLEGDLEQWQNQKVNVCLTCLTHQSQYSYQANPCYVIKRCNIFVPLLVILLFAMTLTLGLKVKL